MGLEKNLKYLFSLLFCTFFPSGFSALLKLLPSLSSRVEKEYFFFSLQKDLQRRPTDLVSLTSKSRMLLQLLPFLTLKLPGLRELMLLSLLPFYHLSSDENYVL